MQHSNRLWWVQTCSHTALDCPFPYLPYVPALQHGIQAVADCTARTVSDSLEAVVEANILLRCA